MNKVILIGNLAADPEQRTTSSGLACTTVRLAVNRRGKDAGCDFMTVVCWRTVAETVGRYLHKGDKCGVVGRLQTRSYDAQDGTKRYVTEVVADEVEFLGKRAEVHPDDARSDNFTEVEDDELPF